MQYEAPEHSGVTGGVVARLRQRILSNELAPGTRLNQAELGAELLRMEEWTRAMERTDDPEEWTRANRAFHALVYEQSGRPRMIALIHNLRRQIDRYQRLH